MENVLKLEVKRESKLKEAGQIRDKIKKEDRAMTDTERDNFNRLMEEVDNIDAELKPKKEEMERMKNSPGKRVNAGEVRVYAPGEERDYVRDMQNKYSLPMGVDPSEVRFGRYVKGIVTGDWKGADAEKRTMNTTVGAEGGFLVPEPLAAEIIGKALNKMRVRQAGARLLPMESKTVTLARLDDMPGTTWKPENELADFDNPSFESINLEAKLLMAACNMSIELFEDGIEVPEAIEEAMSDALAIELDRACIAGSGVAAEPPGLLTIANTLEQDVDGAISDYDDFSEAYQKLQEANEEPNGLIMNPKTDGVLDRLKDNTDQPLSPPKSWEKYRKFVTNNMPEGSAVMGDYRKALIGMRTTMRLESFRGTEDAVRRAQVVLRAYLRADFHVARPAAFCKLTNITY